MNFTARTPQCRVLSGWRNTLIRRIGTADRGSIRVARSWRPDGTLETTCVQERRPEAVSALLEALEYDETLPGGPAYLLGIPSDMVWLKFNRADVHLGTIELRELTMTIFEDWPGSGVLTERARSTLSKWLEQHGVGMIGTGAVESGNRNKGVK